MRALILCEVCPLVHGTRALQMSKVVRALDERAGNSGGRDAVFVFSGVDHETSLAVQAWRAEDSAARDFLPYRLSASTNYTSQNQNAPTPLDSLDARDSPEDGGGRSDVGPDPSPEDGGGVTRIGVKSLFSSAVVRFRSATAKLSRNAPFVAEASRKTRAIIEEFSPDVLLTVANPMLWHRVGLAIREDFRELPWVAFFSDPRPLGLLPKPFRRRNPMNVYKAHLSRRILRNADTVIGPNRYMLEWMEKRLGVSLDGRRYVIPHCGQAASDRLPIESDDLRGWLLHVGSLWKGQVTFDLLRAIKNIAVKYPNQFNGVLCVGHVVPAVTAMVRSLEMESYVKTVGRVSPEEACALIASADANLLADTPLEVGYFLHSKFADYAVGGRPILVVGPATSPMSDYLKSYGGGITVPHRQKEIERALVEIFVNISAAAGTVGDGSRVQRPECWSPTDLARPFLPTSISEEYFRVFEQVAGTANRGRSIGQSNSHGSMRRGA